MFFVPVPPRYLGRHKHGAQFCMFGILDSSCTRYVIISSADINWKSQRLNRSTTPAGTLFTIDVLLLRKPLSRTRKRRIVFSLYTEPGPLSISLSGSVFLCPVDQNNPEATAIVPFQAIRCKAPTSCILESYCDEHKFGLANTPFMEFGKRQSCSFVSYEFSTMCESPRSEKATIS